MPGGDHAPELRSDKSVLNITADDGDYCDEKSSEDDASGESRQYENMAPSLRADKTIGKLVAAASGRCSVARKWLASEQKEAGSGAYRRAPPAVSGPPADCGQTSRRLSASERSLASSPPTERGLVLLSSGALEPDRASLVGVVCANNGLACGAGALAHPHRGDDQNQNQNRPPDSGAIVQIGGADDDKQMGARVDTLTSLTARIDRGKFRGAAIGGSGGRPIVCALFAAGAQPALVRPSCQIQRHMTATGLA